LLFAGLLFASKLGDGTRWLEALLAFASYSLASSASYLFNDVRDAERDRLHPVKCRRPVASGDVSERGALGLAVALAVVALGGTAAAPPRARLAGALLGLYARPVARRGRGRHACQLQLVCLHCAAFARDGPDHPIRRRVGYSLLRAHPPGRPRRSARRGSPHR